MAWSRRPSSATSLLLAMTISLAAGSCSRPSLENELQSAIEACRTGMEMPNPIDKKKELSDKGFSEVSYADAPTDAQKIIDQIKQGVISGRRVEQSDPIALVMKSDTEPTIYFTWINLDTTGTTTTKGHSRLCLVGPLSDEQTVSGLQQVVDYALANNLLGSPSDKKNFASHKARVHDILRHISVRDSSNLLSSAGATYSVNSGSKYLSFYSDAIFGSAN